MKELKEQLHENTLELTTNIQYELVMIRNNMNVNETDLALLHAQHLFRYLAKLVELKEIREMLKEEE